MDKIRLSFEATKDLREKTELIYLTSKIINDIRPKLEVSYTEYKHPDKFSKQNGIIVTLKNNGPYHLIIESAIFHAAQKELPTKSGKRILLDNINLDTEVSNGGQGIAPGAKLDLTVTQSFTEEVDLTQLSGTLDVRMITDPVILETLRSAFPNDYDFSKIEKLSTYKISEVIKPIFKDELN